MALDVTSNDFPSFFKIILELEHRHDLTKLGIPKKFMKDYGTDLLDVVSLETPTGETWEVTLDQENGKAWFRDGWPEFVKYYSICHGHFLMFTYATMSLFKVFIFDMSASEIEYPFDPRETRDMQKEVICESETKINSCSSGEEEGMVGLVTQFIREFGTPTRSDIVKINSYRFDNPVFSVVMRLSYVSYRFRVNVPSVFAAKYMKDKRRSITLQTSIGDTWPVTYNDKTSRFKMFSVGWKKFALDNKLRVGDICVFELVKTKKNLFKVEIIRCSSGVDVDVDVGDATYSSSGGTQVEKIEVISIDD